MQKISSQIQPVKALIALFAAFLIGSVFWSGPPASAVQKTPAVKWLYLTETVDSPSLQLKLNELGKDGWEVFSIARANSVIQAPNIECDKWEVTSKRPAQ